MNDMDMESRVLTLLDYEEVTGKRSRVTISPDKVDYVISNEELVDVQGTLLNRVRIFYSSGHGLEVVIGELDLHALEQAIGTYFL